MTAVLRLDTADRVAYRGVPPILQGSADDGHDQARVTWLAQRWHAQDDVLLRFERQVEENVRMLAGQQWMYWVEQLGQFVDIEDFLTDDEKQWRQRPVFNRILYWYLQKHSRMTENPPIIGFLPGPDRLDAMLAEVMDVWWKTVWREADMEDVLDRFAMWLIPGGRAHLLSRIDWSRGALEEWTGAAALPLVGPDGRPVGITQAPNVPHDADGQPLWLGVRPDGQPIPKTDAHGQPIPAHATHAGQIVVDVLSPLEVRGEYSPAPWHQKRYHMRRVFLTAEDIGELYNVETRGAAPLRGTFAGGGEPMLNRLLFGSGFYGANERRAGSDGMMVHQAGYYSCIEYWEKPCRFEGMEERKGYPGGRHMVINEDTNQRLLDGPREAPFLYTSPIRTVEFIRLPGRHQGTSQQDAINGPQRSFNRLAGHELEHAALMAHPIRLVARGTGLEQVAITNRPNQGFDYNPLPNVKAIDYAAPPPLSADLLRTQRGLLDFMTQIGGTQEAPGEPPTRDASGELVKELRFDRDRDLGPTLRREVVEFGRMAEDHIALAPLLFPFQRVIQYAGEDNIPMVVACSAHLFEQGKVNVVPDPESMLPEGRGERQGRIAWMYENGLFGPPGSPEARAMFFELGRFPHLGRAAKMGGADRTMAEQNLGAILMGTPAAEIPLWPWYDLSVHRYVLERFMKAPEFKRIDPAAQEQLAILWQEVAFNLAQQMPPPVDGPAPAPAGRRPRHAMAKGAQQQAERLGVRPSGPAGPSAADQQEGTV